MRLSEAFADFNTYYLLENNRSVKTFKEYHVRLLGKNGLITTIGDVDIEHLGMDHIIRWKLHMREEGLQPVYINHGLSGVRIFLKWASTYYEMRIIDWHKISFEKEERNKPKVVLTASEIDKLVSYAKNPRDKAIIKLFFGTGCRSAEIIGLNRSHWEAAELVDEEKRIWEIWVKGKNSKYRPVCFYQDVKFMVDAYLATREDCFDPLFISLQNRRVHPNTVGRMLHDATRRAGIKKHVTQHTIRHSFATEMGANGMPIPILAYSLGHSNGVVTQRVYTHINASHTRRAYGQFHPSVQ